MIDGKSVRSLDIAGLDGGMKRAVLAFRFRQMGGKLTLVVGFRYSTVLVWTKQARARRKVPSSAFG